MSRAVTLTLDPAPPATDADAAQQRLSAATERLEQLRHDAADLAAAFDQAVDAGDRAGMAQARARLAALVDDRLIHERAVLAAHVALATAAHEAARQHMTAANTAHAAAIAAADQATEQAREAAVRAIGAGELYKWRYSDFIGVATFEAQNHREAAGHAASGAKARLMDAEREHAQMQAALDAHRRQHRLQLDSTSND